MGKTFFKAAMPAQWFNGTFGTEAFYKTHTAFPGKNVV